MPIYDMVEIIMARHSVPINVWSRLLYRSAYTCFTAFVAILLPCALDLLVLPILHPGRASAEF